MTAKPKWFYDDSLVACGFDGILIRNFYFPSKRSRKIAWTEILSVRRHRLRTFSGRWRVWGMDILGMDVSGLSLQRIWYHLDFMRPLKNEAIIIDAGGLLKVGITPKDLDKVFTIIKQRTR